MLILIAESKTMLPCKRHFSPADIAAHTPVFNDKAAEIMLSLYGLDATDLAKEVKISVAMASKLRSMICEFTDKSEGDRAIEAYTGVVFKAFDFGSLSAEVQRTAIDSVRIVSSLYGWLKPDDIIKAYRFDFTTRVAPGQVTLAAWWKPDLTEVLLKELEARNESEVLDLLPADAAKCFDWKRINQVAKVVKVEFAETASGGRLHTPHAGRLKTLRGSLLRQVVCEDVNCVEGLFGLESPSYRGHMKLEEDGRIIFDTSNEM